MAVILYDLGIRLYKLFILMAYPFHKKARLWIDGRRDFFVVLQRKMYKNTSPLIWFHAASLGEFEQCRPLIEKIKEEMPQYGIFLTFFSPSGYEVRKNYEKADYVFYLPLDTSFNARKFIRVVNPKLALFAKYEFWHHYLNELDRKQIPTVCFSAIFRKEQIFFKPYGFFFQRMLHKFSRIFLQDKNSQYLLNEIGVSNTDIAGDTRFDRVLQNAANARTLPVLEEFKKGSRLLVAGSTWPADMTILIPLINEVAIGFKFVIAPHELSEKTLSEIESKIEKPCIRYSAFSSNNAEAQVLIIDNIGMLSSVYRYGSIAYIGGAFGKGLHNILEPASFGLPVLFGPNYHKFKEARDLVEEGGAFSVVTHMELIEKVKLLESNEVRSKLEKIIKEYVSKNTGATEKIFTYCQSVLK